MFRHWLERRRWRRSHLFDEAVDLALEEISATYGEKALDQARRKAKRRHQPIRRKWVWREVVRRLRAA